MGRLCVDASRSFAHPRRLCTVLDRTRGGCGQLGSGSDRLGSGASLTRAVRGGVGVGPTQLLRRYGRLGSAFGDLCALETRLRSVYGSGHGNARSSLHAIKSSRRQFKSSLAGSGASPLSSGASQLHALPSHLGGSVWPPRRLDVQRDSSLAPMNTHVGLVAERLREVDGERFHM